MSDDLNESQKVLQELDADEYYNISGLISKLQMGNMKYKSRLRGRKLREEKQRRRAAARASKSQPDDEKQQLGDQDEASRAQDRYAEEERIRREREAKITKSAADYVNHKNANISIEIDVDDIEEEEDEPDQIFDRDLYLQIESAFFPPKSKKKNNNIAKDINQLDFAFLQKDLDDSTNKFMLNVLFGDAFKKINHQQSVLADRSLKKCVTEKTMGRFKIIGPLLEGAANQKNQI
ncbi:hypothetical protein M9Y10_032991 [Tritrichomonas musculus]|uniref:Uncharacterized protein n=1 Tax=Tritrichomonas musculus TaxID=1915356 RepID=A0ABR2GXI7_9EUKA